MVDEVCEIVVEIRNLYGLHMRPAMLFADLASKFESEITVKSGDMEIDGKSVAEVMTLGLSAGAKMEITAQGADASRAVDAIRELVEVRLFDESAAP